MNRQATHVPPALLIAMALICSHAGAQDATRGAAAGYTETSSTTTFTADPEARTRPQEVQVWPADSQVLQYGIRAIGHYPHALTHPSLLIYRPRARPVRAAILVFPGGGYKKLGIGPDSTIGQDGVDVCAWLTDAGLTCVLLRYRVPNTGCNWNRVTRRHDTPSVPMALQDAQRAIALVRHNAREFGVEPDRIGVMGFSAGGNLAVLSSTAFATRAYEAIDAADHVSLRPDFAIPVYPGHMTMEHKNMMPRAEAAKRLNSDIVVGPDVPPTLLIHAKDDPIDPVHYSEVYERALKAAGVDVTLRLYESGGHAFGVRRQDKDSDRWTGDAIEWLRRIGIL